MVTDDINHVGLWESYFSNAGKRAKIFVHRAKSWIDSDPRILRRCASEDEECLCSGNVYYARNMGKAAFSARLKTKNRAVKKHVSTSILCNNEAFGKDPAPFIVKSCYCAFENKQKPNPSRRVDPHVSALVRDHMLPINEHVYTAWGDISLVRAAKVLFNRCYSSGAVKCVLLSGSDVCTHPSFR